MPHTVNGIGTHYYGKQDSTSRRGTCRSCGANTTLESYTTRLWFVILFIPIIPLKRLRLLDYCSNCSRHWVANPEQYEMSRQLSISGAMDKYRDQPSVEAAAAVHAQYLSFHMHQEADTFREEVLNQYPDSAELRSNLASHLDETGRWMEATALYEQAFELNPDLPDVRAALAWRRANQNQLEEAYELLDFLRKPGAGHSFNLAMLDTLAKAYQKVGNHDRALELLAHLLRESPTLGEQYEFRKLVAKSEKALRRPASILPDKAFTVRGLFDASTGHHAPWVRWTVLGGVALFLFAVGMAGLNEYRRHHRTLYVVNGFAQPVGISVDGGPQVTVAQRTPISVSEGTHRINVTGPITKQSEINLQTDYWSRWTYSPTWIFNIELAAPVFSSTLIYAAVPQPSVNKLLNDSELNYVPHVDYLFEEPPATIQVNKNGGFVKKVHVGLSPIPPISMLMGMSSEDQNVKLAFAEGYLERNRNDSTLLGIYVHRAQGEEAERRVAQFLKVGLWRTPISIPWHRQYQELKSVVANTELLIEDYDEHLKATPDSAPLLYLRGRIGRNRADELEYFRRADEKDPQLGWPSMALASDAARRGEWDKAKELCSRALNSVRTDPSFRYLWHVVRIANGDAATMEPEYRQQLQSQDFAEVLMAIYFLTDVLAVQQKHEQTRQVAQEFLRRFSGPNSGPADLSAFDPLLDYVAENVDSIRKRMDQRFPSDQMRAQLQGLLAIGEPDAALKIEVHDKDDRDWNERLAISIAYSLAQNQAEADAWRARACDKLQQGSRDEKLAAGFLQNERAPTDDELQEITLRFGDQALLLVALGQRFPDRKADLNRQAERICVGRLPPHLLVKKAIEQP